VAAGSSVASAAALLAIRGSGVFRGGSATSSAKTSSDANATGDLATSVGAPVETLDSAKQFVADYKAAGYKEEYAAYGGYSYDAAWTIIQAVKKVVEDNDGKLPSDAREKITAAVQNVAFDGVTGKVAFDEFGDATNKQLTVYGVKNGAWVAEHSGTYTG